MQVSDVDVYMIGFPKAGTTSFASWLDSAETILVSDPKETFAACPEFATNHRRAGSVTLDQAFRAQKTLGKSESSHSKPLTLEASTLNVYSELLLTQLCETGSKVIVLIRDPWQLVESWHEQMIFAGDTDIKDLSEAWKFAMAHESDVTIDIKRRYTDMFKLGHWTKLWVEAVGHRRLLIIRNTEFADSAALSQKLANFLETDLSALGPIERSNERLRRGAAWLRHLKKSGARGMLRSIDRSGKLERVIRRGFRQFYASSPGHRPADPQLEASVQQQFVPDQRLLERLLADNSAVHSS